MKWSLGKKTKADAVLPAATEKLSLFSQRGSKQASAAATAEVTDFVEMTDVQPSGAAAAAARAMGTREPYLGAHATDSTSAHVSHADFEVPGIDPELVAMAAGELTLEETGPAPVLDAEPVPAQALPVEEVAAAKPSRWSKASKTTPKEPKAAKAAKPSKQAAAQTVHRPLKVLIGYLPDSSERDTYFYMLGVAEKNLDSENIGWAALTKFETGYAYEIHEGGNGRGYLDSLISHFRSLPSFAAEETHRAFIRTATRTVRVERTAKGLYSVILPEADETPQSEWLVANKKLSALVEKRTGLFLGGVVLFLSSLVALMGGYATRYQPLTASMVNIERVPVNKLPHSQWTRLTNLPAGDYVMALKYENNDWLIQTPSNPSGRAAKAVAKTGSRTSRTPRGVAAPGTVPPAAPAVDGPNEPTTATPETPAAGSKMPATPTK